MDSFVLNFPLSNGQMFIKISAKTLPFDICTKVKLYVANFTFGHSHFVPDLIHGFSSNITRKVHIATVCADDYYFDARLKMNNLCYLWSPLTIYVSPSVGVFCDRCVFAICGCAIAACQSQSYSFANEMYYDFWTNLRVDDGVLRG